MPTLTYLRHSPGRGWWGDCKKKVEMIYKKWFCVQRRCFQQDVCFSFLSVANISNISNFPSIKEMTHSSSMDHTLASSSVLACAISNDVFRRRRSPSCLGWVGVVFCSFWYGLLLHLLPSEIVTADVTLGSSKMHKTLGAAWALLCTGVWRMLI